MNCELQVMNYEKMFYFCHAIVVCKTNYHKDMTLKKNPWVILAISLLLVSCKVRKQDSPDIPRLEIETVKYSTATDITEGDIRLHIGVLASDSMQGRGSATSYEALAAEYIKERFESLGLKAFNGNYFQAVPITSRKYFSDCELYFDGYKGDYPSDFRSMIMFDSLTVAGEVVFAGYGNDSDYGNLPVKNKWVMVLENSNSILYERKATAKNNGALGLLVIGIDGTPGGERYVLPADSVPMIKVSRKLSDRLLAHAGTSVREVSEKTKTGEIKSIDIPVVVNATIKSATQAISSQNVVAYLEASDSGQENGYIVIGAHYDHIGTRRVNDSTLLINNGADDNASGTAGVLEIAEKLCSVKGLKYNILFAAFGAEELGLIGSRFFCNNPPVPLEKVKLMINMDMIGRMDSINRAFINTVESNENLNAVINKVKDSHPDVNAVISLEKLANTDHFPFFDKKIPVIGFTTGLHNDYHKPTDTIGSINYTGEKLLLDFIYDIVISPAMDDCIRSLTSSGSNP